MITTQENPFSDRQFNDNLIWNTVWLITFYSFFHLWQLCLFFPVFFFCIDPQLPVYLSLLWNFSPLLLSPSLINHLLALSMSSSMTFLISQCFFCLSLVCFPSTFASIYVFILYLCRCFSFYLPLFVFFYVFISDSL